MLVSPPESSVHNGQVNNAVLHANNDHSTPLAGTVVCCTSVPDEKRTSLAAYAEQMGATHRHPLTLDTTHLIVGDHNSEKYRYVARERPDVRPMTAGWIEAIRDLWMNDQAINMDDLEKFHTLPTLHSLRISMTGCDDATERTSIAEQIKANGGLYEGDLTKQITHLISFRTEGPKYKAARNWGLKVVSIEWLQDTLERGMILSEELYDPLLPVSERGKGAWDRSKPKRTSLGKRQREESAVVEGGKKKLRRSASTKLTSQSSQIWGEIVSGGNIAQVDRSGQWETAEDTTSDGNASKAPGRTNVKEASTRLPNERPKPMGMFSGYHLHYYGFPSEQAQILQNHLNSQGAETYGSIEDMVSAVPNSTPGQLIVMIPHNLPGDRQIPVTSFNGRVEVVTVWWLERCLHNKKFLDPKEHVIGRPFKQFPIAGFEKLSIATSAFSGIDLLHVTKAIGLLGAKYDEEMTAQSTVIVSKTLDTIRKDKLDFAQAWKIPIVSAQWLWDSIEAGELLSFQTYRARQKKLAAAAPQTDDKDREEIRKASSDAPNQPKQQVNKTSTTVSKVPLKDTPSERPKRLVTLEPKDEPTSDDNDTPLPSEGTNSTTQENPRKSEPLAEIENNSSITKPAVAIPSLSEPAPHSREYDSNAISDLLSKTKSAAAQAPLREAPRNGFRGKRILGRALSNLSNGSAHSRAASVDPAGSNNTSAANVEDDNDNETFKNRTSNERIEMLLSGNDHALKDVDSQPPLTQLEYDDPESRAAEERLRTKMLGAKAGPKRKLEKTKTLTLNDVETVADKVPRTRRAKSGVR